MFSDDIDDIIPMRTGMDALHDLLSEDGQRTLEQFVDTQEQIETMCSRLSNSPFGAVLSTIPDQINALLQPVIDEAESRVVNLRKWGQECYALMKAHVPFMTGHLRDSIRFAGSGLQDFDVTIDPELLDEVEYRMPQHIWYNGKKRKSPVRVGGYSHRGWSVLGYLEYVDEHAWPKNWWTAGSHADLRDTIVGPTSYWELNIKMTVAAKYDVDYVTDENPPYLSF